MCYSVYCLIYLKLMFNFYQYFDPNVIRILSCIFLVIGFIYYFLSFDTIFINLATSCIVLLGVLLARRKYFRKNMKMLTQEIDVFDGGRRIVLSAQETEERNQEILDIKSEKLGLDISILGSILLIISIIISSI